MSTERRKRMDGFSPSSPRSLVPLVPKLRLGMRPAKLCFANPGVTSADIDNAEAELWDRVPKQSLGTSTHQPVRISATCATALAGC